MAEELRYKINSLQEHLDKIEEVIETREFNVQTNIKGLVRNLLWDIIMSSSRDKSYDKVKGKEAYLEIDLDRLIECCFNTTHEDGPEGETYTTWSTEAVKSEMARVKKAIKKYTK